MAQTDQAEQVLCVPTGEWNGFADIQGFVECSGRDLDSLLDHAVWKNRGPVESNTQFKQVIGYAYLHTPDGSLLWYRRSKREGEQRLLGQASLGFGGHIHPHDAPSKEYRAVALFPNVQIVNNALARELTEELGIVGFSAEFQGLVNDESTPVGQVHLGAVYSVKWTDGTLPSLKEGDGSYSLGFHPCDKPPVAESEMESWSRIVWEHIQERVRS